MIHVAAFYRFARFGDPKALRPPLRALCQAVAVRGSILLATEGINGTIAGAAADVERVLAHIRSLPDCGDLDVRHSTAATMPFHRLKVRLKREIVTMGEPAADPRAAVGTYVAPAAWNALIADPATIVIDTRNAYEVRLGSFAGAIDPGTRHFSEFPDWFRANRDTLLAGTERPKIAMFCTGGIRCERATALLKAEGIEEVYHLKGGILNYLEQVPVAESRWQGECFVFDQRVAVDATLATGTYGLCFACRMPVSDADRASSLYADGISCPQCHANRDERQRAGYAERHRQQGIAERRGGTHVGDRPT